MIWQRVKSALLASMVAMAAAFPVAQGGKALAGDCAPACPAASSTSGSVIAAPAMRTIRVVEMVPEYVTETRTVNKQIQVQEKYTAWKCEKVPVTKTRKVIVHEKVPVTEIKAVTRCEKVPVCVQKTCMEKCYVNKQVTCYKTKCVDKGHYECRQVEKRSHPFKRKSCGDSCDPCAAKCVEYKTKKVWVPCKVTVQEPYCKTVRVCEYKPVVKNVTEYRTVTKVENVKVCTTKCIAREKEETYTECIEKKTPIECTRTVTKCVPVQEQVKVCKMVKREVEKQVPACEPTSCDPCKKRKHGLFGR